MDSPALFLHSLYLLCIASLNATPAHRCKMSHPLYHTGGIDWGNKMKLAFTYWCILTSSFNSSVSMIWNTEDWNNCNTCATTGKYLPVKDVAYYALYCIVANEYLCNSCRLKNGKLKTSKTCKYMCVPVRQEHSCHLDLPIDRRKTTCTLHNSTVLEIVCFLLVMTLILMVMVTPPHQV